jgi:hypothetical protein
MAMYRSERIRFICRPGGGTLAAWVLLLATVCAVSRCAGAQSNDPQSLAAQVEKLTAAMARTQAQLEQSQHELENMRSQLSALQSQISQNQTTAAAAAISAAVDDLREHQAMNEAQIATQEQSKVGSASRFPVKITGMLLLSGFVNTRGVDVPATPSIAYPGRGSSGASIRQTILGLDASGPHLFGASSYADLRADFYGNGATSYTGYYGSSNSLLRLRTAHAGLRWKYTEAFFSLDRPIFSPDTPTSLTAVAMPALAWSGNLWTWNPQLGLNQDIPVLDGRTLRLQAALVDVGDAPLTPQQTEQSIAPPNSAERSRWPGVEAHIALLGQRSSSDQPHNHIGIGGYFAPHSSAVLVHGFDSWAATLDAGLQLPARLQITGSFYRGLALGGLGGGAYKDFAFNPTRYEDGYYFRPLNDVGGWAQLKEKFSQRFEANAAFGIDNAFAAQVRRYAMPGDTFYQDLVRNRTFTGNFIYSPSAYLLFSLEYRHLESIPVTGSSAASDVVGLGAGYRF